MPVCEPCRDAADGLDPGPIPVCSHCGQGPVRLYRTDVPLVEQSVVRHMWHDREWCPGSKKPPRMATSHDHCDGCPCQHKPRGSWKGKQ